MVSRLLIVLVLALIIAGCAAILDSKLPQRVVELRTRMERYLIDNGFTCEAPRNSDAYAPRRMLEQWLSEEDIAQTRRCDFRKRAFSYAMDEDGTIEFVFRQDRPPHLAHFAGIRADGSVWVNESYCGLTQHDHIRLPR